MKPKLQYTDQGSGEQRDDHIEHQAPGVCLCAHLGLVGYVKDNSFLFIAHFAASFAARASASAFSFAALAWNISLAVLNACVSGMRAGQL